MKIVVIYRCFGPRFSERELRRMNNRNELGTHAGCWVNAYDCGADCVMAPCNPAPASRTYEARP